MKKYFLLFTAAFIVFEACLIAGSSQSYGMEPQIEDDGRSIVVHNSQGQKIQKISLHGEDPAADTLYPFRGETFWVEFQCHHPYLDGKVYSFLYPERFEMRLSYPARNADLLSLAYELHASNIEKTGISNVEKDMKASYKNSEGIKVVSFNGNLEQHHLTFSFKSTEALHSPHEFRSLLRALQKSAQAQDVHTINTSFFPAPLVPFSPPPHISVLQEEGFTSMGEIIDFDTGQNMTAYYKILPFHRDEDRGEDISNIKIQWEIDDTFSPPNFGTCFGIFVRDDKSSIKGGISGSIHPEAAFPHSEIDLFWNAKAVRGKGFGQKIFGMAEAFSKENGVCFVELSTMDYQAPEFYKKMGYTPFITECESEKTLDGKWANGYLFRKQL